MTDTSELVLSKCTEGGVEHAFRSVHETLSRYDVRVSCTEDGVRLCVGVDPTPRNPLLNLGRGTCQNLSPDEARHIAKLLIAASKAVTP